MQIETGGWRMIPKIIHYGWFDRKCLLGIAEKCMASWKNHAVIMKLSIETKLTLR